MSWSANVFIGGYRKDQQMSGSANVQVESANGRLAEISKCLSQQMSKSSKQKSRQQMSVSKSPVGKWKIGVSSNTLDDVTGLLLTAAKGWEGSIGYRMDIGTLNRMLGKRNLSLLLFISVNSGFDFFPPSPFVHWTQAVMTHMRGMKTPIFI